MKLCIVSSGNFFSNYGGGQVYVKNLVDELIRQRQSLEVELTVISFAAEFSVEPTKKDYCGIDLYEMNGAGDIQALLHSIQPEVVHAHGEKARVVNVCHDLGIRCVVTAHHGGICCPAGALLNDKDQICCEAANLKRCLPCYLRNIRSGRYWYPVVRHIPSGFYIKLGKGLRKLPFIPFVSPIGEAMLAIQEKISQWSIVRNLASHIIAPSNAIADSMILNGCDKNKISVIPHGIPLTKETESTSFNPLVAPPSIVAFYYVGRICYVKGVHVMLKAFSDIRNEHIELHIIGGAGNKEEERYLQKLKKQYQSDKRIQWHGKVIPDHVAEMTNEYHCLIHSTICLEIFGLNIAEALAQHKYVIATRCGGAEMQIHSSKEGALVEPNSVDELRVAMERYLLNPIASQSAVKSIETHVLELLSTLSYGKD